MQINQVWRRSRNQFSIENVFKSLNKELAFKDENILTLSRSGGSPKALILNWFQVFFHSSKIIHVVGDVHYVGIQPFKKVILTVHDLSSLRSGNSIIKWFKLFIWVQLPCIFANQITVISEATKQDLENTLWVKRRIKVIPNPLTLSTIDIGHTKERNTILVVGTKKNKAVDYILREVKGLEYKIFIVGVLDEGLKSIIIENKLDVVNYINIPSEELLRLYKKTEILIFASISEGFGLPVLEAQSQGTIVFANDIEVLRFVGGDSCVYFDTYQEGSLRNALEMFNSESQGHIYKVRGRLNLERFSVQKVAKSYLNIYESAG